MKENVLDWFPLKAEAKTSSFMKGVYLETNCRGQEGRLGA